MPYYPFSTKETIACKVAEKPASLCSSPYLETTKRENQWCVLPADIKYIQTIRTFYTILFDEKTKCAYLNTSFNSRCIP